MTNHIGAFSAIIALILASVSPGVTAARVPPSSFLSSRELATDTAENDICLCAPTKFNFVLSLSQNCDDNNDINDNDGIDGAFCFVEDDLTEDDLLESDSEPIRRRRLIRNLEDATPVEIVSVQFLEFDTQGDLVVINQDDTYSPC